MTRHTVTFLILIFFSTYDKITVESLNSNHIFNTKGMRSYIKIIQDEVIKVEPNIWDNLQQTKEKYYNGLNVIYKIVNELDNITRIYDKMDNQLNVIWCDYKSVDRIETRYREFRGWFTGIIAREVTKELYTNATIKYTEKNMEDLDKLRKLSLPKLKNNITVVFTKKSYSNICQYNYSVLKSYFYMYQHLMMLELKSYLIDTYIQLLYTYHRFGLTKQKKPDIRMYNLYRLSATQLRANIKSYESALINYRKSYSTGDLYGCTSGQPIRHDETLELHGVFQKFIGLEPDLTSDGSCPYETCSFPLIRHDTSFKFPLDGYLQTKPCNGVLTACNALDDVEICYSHDKSLNRYEGLTINNEIYGNMNSCSNGRHKIYSWRRLFHICDICLCTCSSYSSDKTATQKISFMPELSDINRNMVITNVKFIEKNQTIHIKIEQKKLSNLNDNPSDNRDNWKPVNEPWLKTDVTTINENKKYFSYEQTGNKLSYGKVGHELSILLLDDIILPLGYVVTGIKFQSISSFIQLKLRATPYNLIKNELILTQNNMSTSFWMTSDVVDKTIVPEYQHERTAAYPFITEDHLDPPILAFNIKDSKPNQYVLFRSSGLHDNIGQSTVPYFDSRPTNSKFPFPLRGIGLSMKAYNSTNGYLTFKTIPYTIPSII